MSTHLALPLRVVGVEGAALLRSRLVRGRLKSGLIQVRASPARYIEPIAHG